MSCILKAMKRGLRRRYGRWWKGALALVALLVAINIVLCGWFWSRTYPRTQVGGAEIGSVVFGKAEARLAKAALLAEHIQFVLPDGTVLERVEPEVLGVRADDTATARQITAHRSWLPLWEVFRHHTYAVKVMVNQAAFEQHMMALVGRAQRPPLDARLVLANDVFTIVPDKPGFVVQLEPSKKAVMAALQRGDGRAVLPAKTQFATIRAQSLQGERDKLQRQLRTAITFRLGNNQKRASPADIATWFVSRDKSYAVAGNKVQDYVTGLSVDWNVRAQRLATAATTAVRAVETSTSQTILLEPASAPLKTFTYCVAVRGVATSYLQELKRQLRLAYADPRGWSMDGRASFVESATNCNFTVWLSAPDQMSSFGSICDPLWSCEIGQNVVLNFDRWQQATDPWNASGGELGEYRFMAINHETGHWLGFGHSHCGGTGQPAAVMQQQSVNLEGCVFNAWPTPSEQTVLRTRLSM